MHEARRDEWVYTKGENSKAVQDIMKCLVGAGWAISHALSINGPRKQSSQLVGLPVPVFKVALHEWVWLELCMCM